MSANFKLTLIAAMVLIAVAGCTTSQNVGSAVVPQRDNVNTATRAGFSLDVSDDSYVDGGSASGYDLTVKDYGEDLVVSVEVEDAQHLKALYFDLNYNPEQVRPLTAEPTEAMGDKQNVLSLSSMKQRGTVVYGQVLGNFEYRPGLTGSAIVAQLMFRKEATPAVPRGVSAVPTTTASASIITFDSTNTTAELHWDYANRGDYDQNGLVNVSDLTPLGANLQEDSGNPPNPFPRAENRSQIDGDNNGILNIQDLTPLGASLQNGVTGYNVYASTDPTHTPTDNTTPSDPADRLGNVVMADHQGASTVDRIFWTFDVASPQANERYWVRPYEGDQANEGTSSNVVGDIPSPNLTLQSPPVAGTGTAVDPYIVSPSDPPYTLILTDPTDGDVSTSGSTTYNTSDTAHVTFASNVMTIGAGAAATFTVYGSYNGVNSNILSFELSGGGSGIVISPEDATVAPWSSVPNIADGDVGTVANPYTLHDSGFNPDAGADGTYDLEFALKSQDDSSNDIDESTLTWAGFPPFVALDINDASKGTFHANQFSVGYVFAQNVALDESNHLYIEVKLDQN